MLGPKNQAMAKHHPGQKLIQSVMEKGGLNLPELREEYDADTVDLLMKKRPGILKNEAPSAAVVAAELG